MATMNELRASMPARQRVEEALNKAKALQPLLNAVVTFVDPKSQVDQMAYKR